MPRVLGFVGVSAMRSTAMMTGAAIGLAVASTAWLVGVRYVYLPPKLPKWLLRGSVQISVVVGSAIALAVG